MRVKDIALDGVVRQNPTFRLVLGTCPTLALTTAAFNGIGMGLSVTFVLICSNVLVSLLRKIIPDKVRIPAFVLIIATFVTVVQMVLKKFMPDLYDSLGVFLPLIVVNCIILAARSPLRVTTRWAIRRLTVCLWDSALPPRSRLWARSGKFSATAPFSA